MIIVYLLVLNNAFLFRISPALSISPPRNYMEASQVGFQGIVLNSHPLVFERLKQITKSFDQRSFADNLIAVYDYVKSLPYSYDRDAWGTGEYWATGPETIQTRRGDCEDHAILLATLIEALYGETYGRDRIPQNLIWVVIGTVKLGPDASDLGCHAWTIINLGALPEDASSRIKSAPRGVAIIDAVIRDIITPKWQEIGETWRRLDLTKLAFKSKPLAMQVFWLGDQYVELESTWASAISEYVNKCYPYTELFVAFNSYQCVYSPDFVPSGRPPIGSGAVINNVAYNREVRVNEVFSIKVTVRNFDLGTLGATLVLVVRSDNREIARQSAYVFRYLWSIHTFSLNVVSTSPGTRECRLELYWDNQGSLQLQDSTEFRISVGSGAVPTITTSVTSGRVTYRFFSLPEDCQREQPSSYESRDLGKIIRIEGVGSYRTPFSLQLTPGVTYIFTSSGAIAWDYYGIGPKQGETIQYTLNELNTEIAAYFATRLTYRFFSLPEDCRGQQPSSNAHKDLGKVIMIEEIGSYRTPFSVQLTPRRTYTFTSSGAVSWDYYTVGWKNGQTVQYTLDEHFDEIAAFFATSRTPSTASTTTGYSTEVIITKSELTLATIAFYLTVVGGKTFVVNVYSTTTESREVTIPVGGTSDFSLLAFGLVVFSIVVCVIALLLRMKKSVRSKPKAFPQTAPPIPVTRTGKFCRHCGAKIPHDSAFCEVCGRKL